MAHRRRAALPDPPADFDRRKLPLKRIQGSIFRVHRRDENPLYFGKNRSGRFDDPLGRYGVFYAALQPEAAFAEVFLRKLSLMLLRELDVQERSITEMACGGLDCVDLTGSGLRRISCDNRVATELPYDTTGRWSRAVFAHPQRPDGVIYRSRHNPQYKCLALFARCRERVRLGRTEQLLGETRRAWTIRQIAKYNLALEPAP